MRLLMLDNEFPPLGGGTGVVNLFFLKELAHDPEMFVDLVTSSRTKSNYEQQQFSERITIHKVPVDNQNIHHSSNLELMRYAWRGLKLCRKLLDGNQYDLSFAFAGVPAGAISYMLRVISGLPYIVSLQGPDVPGFEARYNYLYPFLKPLLRIIWGSAGAVTAISHEHKQLAKKTMPNLEIPVIYNGVDTTVFAPVATEAFSTELKILCVGRLIERKGQHHLLEAFAGLLARTEQSLRLILAGTGDFEPQLRQQADTLGIRDRVDFLGYVPRDEMPQVYRNADVFVLPSQSEGMSIALLEAMASGLPVIATQTGGTDELLQDDWNGLIVEWADVTDLERALCRLVQDDQLRRQLGAYSRLVSKKFSWQEYSCTYTRLCRLVASGMKPTPAISWR